MVTRIRQDATCGENRSIEKKKKKKQSPAREPRHPRRAFGERLGKRTDSAKLSWHRDNDRNISPSGWKGAPFPPPRPRLTSTTILGFDVVGNARRQRFFLNRPRRLRSPPPHLFAFPQLVPGCHKVRRQVGGGEGGRTIRRALTGETGLSSRYVRCNTRCSHHPIKLN